MALISYCRDHSIEEVLSLPDVKERVDVYVEHAPRAKEQIQRCASVHKNLVVLDLRNEEPIWACNRFMVYALLPEINISIHVLWGAKHQSTVFATGKSNLNRTSKTDIGALMLEYGGGGHEAAGTCQVSNDEADAILAKLVKTITGDG
jgi:nanoRNase/pAp phosphatase (c-di-AMP/oligoRNAs hydrolase)